MADRRMFAKTIIDSDAFLDMPQSTQLLYFHLAMRADDDGFINNPKSIARNVKCNEDDLKILAMKKFIIPFESGIVVIKHWKIHNYIRADRYKETKYKEEKSRLMLDENKAYSVGIPSDNQVTTNMDTNGIPSDNHVPTNLDTNGIPSDNHVGDSWYPQDSIDKYSIVQDNKRQNAPTGAGARTREGEKRTYFTPPTIEEVREYCRSRNNNVDPEQFYDFYESKGWMIGKNRMKDWKAAVRTWERDRNRASQSAKTNESSFDTDDFFQAALQRSMFDLSEGGEIQQ